MDKNDLLDKQKKLQLQADEFLNKLQLVELLSPFGEVVSVGSREMGLMTKRDIDLSVVGPIDKDVILNLANKLLSNPYVCRLTFQNTLENSLPNTTTGMYLGVQGVLEDIKEPWERIWQTSQGWKVDIWFIEDKDDPASKLTSYIKSKLNEETRLAILRLKYAFIDNPKIKSVDIYDAVIESRVRDIEDFERYLKEKESSL